MPYRLGAPLGHRILAVAAILFIVLHFFMYGELYEEILNEGITLNGLGAGRELFANLAMLTVVTGSLLCLISAAIRSFLASEDRGYLTTVGLLVLGLAIPPIGLILVWFIGGDV